MSDLDLDAAVARADRYKALFDDLVERRRGLVRRIRELEREKSVELANAEAKAEILLARVAELEANQLPDGGEWQYGVRWTHLTKPAVDWLYADADTARQYVGNFATAELVRRYIGPTEPVGDSGPRSDVDPDSATQTTV